MKQKQLWHLHYAALLIACLGCGSGATPPPETQRPAVATPADVRAQLVAELTAAQRSLALAKEAIESLEGEIAAEIAKQVEALVPAREAEERAAWTAAPDITEKGWQVKLDPELKKIAKQYEAKEREIVTAVGDKHAAELQQAERRREELQARIRELERQLWPGK